MRIKRRRITRAARQKMSASATLRWKRFRRAARAKRA